MNLLSPGRIEFVAVTPEMTEKLQEAMMSEGELIIAITDMMLADPGLTGMRPAELYGLGWETLLNLYRDMK
jgi:hypothetical protein